MKSKATKYGFICILAFLLASVRLASADEDFQETRYLTKAEIKLARKEQKRLEKLEKKRLKEEKKQRDREEKSRKKEEKRMAKLEKKRIKELKKHPPTVIACSEDAEADQALCDDPEEARQSQVSDVQMSQNEEAERARLEKLDRQRQADDRQTQELVNDITTALSSVCWNQDQLAVWVNTASKADRSLVSKSLIGRVHLALGLYAYFCDDNAQAQNEWSRAKQCGVINPRAIAEASWTPGALEEFAQAR